MLCARDIRVTLGACDVLKGVDVDIEAGQLLVVIGPNGSGKTTLLRALTGSIKHTGTAMLDGRDISKMKPRERARRIGVLTQRNDAQFAYTAVECVALGRYAHRSAMPGGLNARDKAAVDTAFELTRTGHLRNRMLTTLSGGELQRVCLARALAQEPDVLMLDEPTNHLDIEHQIILFDIIHGWVKDGRRAALAIVHDLNLAYAYGTRAMLLDGGLVYANGLPEEVFKGDTLKNVYHTDVAGWMRGMLSRWAEGETENK